MFHTHACSYGFSASTYGLKGHGIITTICIQSNAKFTSYSLQTEVMYGLLWQHHSALKHSLQHRLEVGLQVYPLEQSMSPVLVCPERLPRLRLHVQKIWVSLILIKLSNFKEFKLCLCVKLQLDQQFGTWNPVITSQQDLAWAIDISHYNYSWNNFAQVKS